MTGSRATVLAGALTVACAASTASPRIARADGPFSTGEGAVTGAAGELVREARAHEAVREDDLAFRRYAEALALDPSFEAAYLGLAALRLRTGDAREAERVYATGLSHVPGFLAAWLGRARARRALGALREADADLEAYIEGTSDPDVSRELAGWYAEEGRPLAELATWRHILTTAERGKSNASDALARKEARLTVHALEVIVGTADAVRNPPGDTKASRLRRGMARMEKRR